MKPSIRLSSTLALVAITIAAFIWYIHGHNYLLTKLGHTPFSTVVWLLLLYCAWFGALVLISLAILQICKKTLGVKENFLLNAYSTFVNFFVPGQGGIAVRGVYLKKIKNLPIRSYILVYLIYYGFYAVISILLALSPNRPIWQTIGAVIIVALISFVVIYLFKNRSKTKSSQLDLSLKSFLFLFVATLLQALVQVIIFSVELRSVSPHVAIHQTIAYTGVANFALFVALTPGAIGIRESFLVLSRKILGISSANIVAANVIDRAVFIVFLGILFVLTIGFHAKYRSLFARAKIGKDLGTAGNDDSSAK